VKKIIAVLLAVIVLGALFFVLKPQPKTTQNSEPTQTETGSEPEIKAFALELRDGELVSGEATLKVNQGDQVRITLTASEHDEVHLHGYDKEMELSAGQPSELNFTADLTGRFEAELHHAEKPAFVLEVQPK
jgi:plastocyanin